MIKATELRIGNIVCPVSRHTEIHMPDTLVQLRITGIALWSVEAHLFNKNLSLTVPHTYDINDISGIPLNPEILESCGFVKTNIPEEYELKIDEEESLVANPFILGGYSIQNCVQGNWSGQKKQYLHQLQNLYSALTGEEIKLEQKGATP